MAQKFSIAARSPLMAGISSSATSITVDLAKADLFPVADTGTDPIPTTGKDWFKIVLEDASANKEIVYVRTRTLGSASMTNCLRGQEGTTARAFIAGSVVGLRHTAADLADAIDLAASASSFGKTLLQNATDVLARAYLGATTVGHALFTAASAGDARSAIGAQVAGSYQTAGSGAGIASLPDLVGPGLVSVGAIIISTGNTALPGTVTAYGALLSRTAYADLWAFAQASGNLAASDGAWTNGQYSPGDGSTTFRTPDLRGETVRFWDAGRGVDSGRAFGSTQLDQMQRITGTVDAGAGNAGARLINGSASGAFALTKAGGTGYMVTGVGYTTTDYTTSEVFDSGNSPSARVSSTTAGETRSRNVAYLPCIKY